MSDPNAERKANAAPPHAAVEGPEEPLEPIRQESHHEPGEADALRRRLEALEAREKELVERLARMQADFDNFRRRSRDEAATAAGRGKEGVLKALLPVLDNLDRALAHAKDEGLALLARQLADTLRQQGVVVVAPEGETFDARVHEAIAQEPRDGVKAGTVLVVAEKGYLLDGKVVRPARVVVAA